MTKERVPALESIANAALMYCLLASFVNSIVIDRFINLWNKKDRERNRKSEGEVETRR